MTANSVHMRTNAHVDFEITIDDIDVLNNVKEIQHYGGAESGPWSRR